MPSDDTQMSFWTLGVLLEDGRLDPDHLARRFCQEQIYGIGSRIREFISKYKAGNNWRSAGVNSAGNGALMRNAPMLHVARYENVDALPVPQVGAGDE